MLARISSREFAEWQAFERIEGPITGLRADAHAALIASMIAALGGSKKEADHFMPKWDSGAGKDKVPVDQDEIRRKALAAFGLASKP